MDIRRAFLVGLLAMLVIGCQAKSRHATLPDETSLTVAENDAELTVRLEGGYFSPLLLTVVISNQAPNVQCFPEPLIMPLTGEHGRNNNVRILTRKGGELSIHGVHFDFTKQPRVEIPSHEVGTWAFDLDFHFPQLAEAGSYEVFFRYAHEAPECWTGEIEIGPIPIEVTVKKLGWFTALPSN